MFIPLRYSQDLTSFLLGCRKRFALRFRFFEQMLKRALKIGPGSGLPDRPTSPSWPAFINSQSHRHTLLRSRQRNGSGGLAMLRGSSEGPLSSAKPRASSAPPSIIARGLALFPSVHRAFVGETFDIRSLRRDPAFYTDLKPGSTPPNQHSFVTRRGRPEPLTPTAPAISRLSCLASDELFPAIPIKVYRSDQMAESVRVLRTEYTVPSPLR